MVIFDLDDIYAYFIEPPMAIQIKRGSISILICILRRRYKFKLGYFYIAFPDSPVPIKRLTTPVISFITTTFFFIQSTLIEN